jgi:tetratricopeptide (TPR) repeat protein
MTSVALSESATAPEPARADPAPAEAARVYDAFISYSHALDKPIASALQSAMQRLGKAWYQRRALRLFRDDTSLTATPHLWPSIEQALGKARFLILLASPEAAASPWVGKELEWWLLHRGPDTVLLALTAGELAWDGAAGDFRWSAAMPLPPVLMGRFADEPLWVDLREYRDRASPRDARFTDLAASIAAALHGRPKEDLLSQEVRQQRRALRLAGGAVALLLVLLALAGWQWTVARAQRNRAEHNLALATETANALVRDLAEGFRDSGVPAKVVADILARARALQDQLIAGGEMSPELRISQGAALNAAANTLLAMGDTKGALSAARQAHDIVQSLAAAAPDNGKFQSLLATADDKLGRVLLVVGDVGGALAAYRESLAIRQTLARQEPDNAEQQRALAIAEEEIGDALKTQGDLAGALAAFQQSIAISRALAQRNPGDTTLQSDISAIDQRIGSVLMEQRRFDEALAAYNDALAIARALAQKDPANTGWRSEIAMCDDRVGSALEAKRDTAGALAAYRDSLSARTALATSDPGNAEWQHAVAVSDNKVGDILMAQGQTDDALVLYRHGQAIMQALVQKDPGNAEWQHALAFADSKMADMLSAKGDSAGALAMNRAALAIVKALAEKTPTDVQLQEDLVVCLYRIAALGDNPRANLSEALAIVKRLDAAGLLSAGRKAWAAQLETALATADH